MSWQLLLAETENELGRIKLDNARLRREIKQFLKTVSVEWYVQQFHRSEKDNDVFSMIHNAELEKRAIVAFTQLKRAIEI